MVALADCTESHHWTSLFCFPWFSRRERGGDRARRHNRSVAVDRLYRYSDMARDGWCLAVFLGGSHYGFYAVTRLSGRLAGRSAVPRLYGRGQRPDTLAAQSEYDSFVAWNRTKDRSAAGAGCLAFLTYGDTQAAGSFSKN
jgi:hypothetical protein